MSDIRADRRGAKLVAIDDDPLVIRLLERHFGALGMEVIAAVDGRTGLDSVRRERPSAVILDNVLPDLEGLEVLRQIYAVDPHLPVLFITAQGTSHTAIEAMKRRAFDYLPKPLNLERLEQQLDHALEARRLMRVPVEIDDGTRNANGGELLLGRSPAMQEAFKAVGRLALEDSPILIEGESGTGKELTARAIHQHGPRSGGPFGIVHCGDFAAGDIEVELFGDGAPTGNPEPSTAAPNAGGSPLRRAGRIEGCRGGVLLVEEIGRLPQATQSRLFRALKERAFERVGGGDTARIDWERADARIIATTTERLELLVEQGRFRADLYYMLASFRIELPPLRRRIEDIPALVDLFVKQFSRIGRVLSTEPARVSPEALSLLSAYPWPGNLDELQSVLRRALVETKGTVVASDSLLAALGAGPRGESDSPAQGVTDWRTFAGARIGGGSQQLYADSVEEMERNVLAQVLHSTQGNQARAARILGITRGNLRKKIRALGLTLPSPPAGGAAAAVDAPLSAPHAEA